jgi:spermidine/putrescine transport system ATP-binding protein
VGITFIHVTHDQEEAMTMADSIAVMNDGHIEQLGSPTELYEHPKTAFVASFLGVSNLLPGTVAGADTVRLDTGAEVRVTPGALAGLTGRVAVGVRPEKLVVGGDDVNRLSGFVAEVSYIGVSSQFIVKTDAGPVTVYVQNSSPGVRPVAEGNAVALSWSPEATFVVEVPEGGTEQ